MRGLLGARSRQPGFLQNFNEVEFDLIYSDWKAAYVVFRRKRIDFDNSGSREFQIYHPHIRTAAQANQRRVGTSTAQLQRTTHLNHLRSYDFLEARTEPGDWLQILAVLDEYTRQFLAIDAERGTFLSGQKGAGPTGMVVLIRGRPEHLRSDNGPEFIARRIQTWLAEKQCQTLYITPGSPWVNPFIESFIGKIRTEWVDQSWFTNGREARQLVEQW